MEQAIRSRGFRLFLDLNETLIRTGEVSFEDRIREQKQLQKFKAICLNLVNKYESFELIFITGNSFEYSRRVEEPLGLKNIPGLELIIVSENGLLARSFYRGNLWKCGLLAEYKVNVNLFFSKLSEAKFTNEFYFQGNELRKTLKPVKNSFTEENLLLLENAAENSGLNQTARIFHHPFYFDIDPLEVVYQKKRIPFTGKEFATETLIASNSNFFNVGIGDSASDIPTFTVLKNFGGDFFWVGNTKESVIKGLPTTNRTKGIFTAGVNEALLRYL